VPNDFTFFQESGFSKYNFHTNIFPIYDSQAKVRIAILYCGGKCILGKRIWEKLVLPILANLWSQSVQCFHFLKNSGGSDNEEIGEKYFFE